MKFSISTLATVALASNLCAGAMAQVAGGTTTVGVKVTESTEIAFGWSVKNTLMGKTVYNTTGDKVGKVDDLIISPEKNVSYVIIGAGGFIGIGRHDVAVPVNQIKDVAGKLIMAGATKELIRAMPGFSYATDTTRRDAFVAAAEKDIEKGKTKITQLEKRASLSANEAKDKINLEIATLKSDVLLAETKVAEMRRTAVSRWREFELDINATTARIRRSLETAAG